MAPGHTEAVAEKSQDDMPNGDARPHSRHRLSLAQLSGIRASLDTPLDTTAVCLQGIPRVRRAWPSARQGRDAGPGWSPRWQFKKRLEWGVQGPFQRSCEATSR